MNPLSAPAAPLTVAGAVSAATVRTPGTALDRQAAHGSSSAAWTPVFGSVPLTFTAGAFFPPACHPSTPDPAIEPRSRRRDGGLMKGALSKKSDRMAGAIDPMAHSERCGAIEFTTRRPSHPTDTIAPHDPVAFINSLPDQDPRMAQRESEPILLYDELERIKRRKMSRASRATSPGGVHITNEEREDIADLDMFQKRFSRWVAAHRLAEKIDRMGLDAPSVQRALREIMRDLDITLHDHDEPEGMRR